MIGELLERFGIGYWEVNCSDWTRGRFEYGFFRRESAEKWAKEQWDKWLFIDLKNHWTETRVRLKANPDKIEPPPMIVPCWRGNQFEPNDKVPSTDYGHMVGSTEYSIEKEE